MKSPDQLWQQLVATARLAPPVSREPTWGRVEHLLRPWRAEPAPEAANLEVMVWMGRRVLLSAVVVMAAALVLSYLPWIDTWTVLSTSAPWLEVVADL